MSVDEMNPAPMGDVDEEIINPLEPTEQEPPAADFLNNPEILEFIQKQVQDGIKKALKGKPPKANTIPASTTEKAEFDKMSYRERLKLYQSNPQAYYKLAKGGI